MLGGRYTGTPALGMELTQTQRQITMARRLAETRRIGLVFGLDLKGVRREHRGAEARPEHQVLLGLDWNLAKTRHENVDFKIRIEASRLEAGNQDRAPEDRLGVSVTARW